MNENTIPKWQRELRSFLGIKSGIILEGNVYDEYERVVSSSEKSSDHMWGLHVTKYGFFLMGGNSKPFYSAYSVRPVLAF